MFPMLLIQIVFVLLVVGVLLWGLSAIPLDPTIKQIIRVVIIVFVCLWLIYILMGAVGGGFPAWPRR